MIAQLDKAMTVAFSYYTESVLPSKPVQAAKAVKDAFYAKHPENLELFKKACGWGEPLLRSLT